MRNVMKAAAVLVLLFGVWVVGQSDYVPLVYSPSAGTVSTGYASGGTPSTNLQFDAMNIGNLTITTNGATVTNNYGWEDLRFPVGIVAPVTPNADVVLDEDENAITFETGCSTNRLTDDHIWGVAQMPHTWRTNTAVSLHVHFEQTNSDQTNMWYAYIRRHPLGGAKVTAWTFVGPATNLFTYSSGTLHQLAYFPEIDMTGMRASSIMDWKIFRDGTEGTGDVDLKETDIHYQIEKPTGELLDI